MVQFFGKIHGTSLSHAYKIVQTIPNVGVFYAAKIVLLLKDLNLITDDHYPLLGPGSKKALHWIFDLPERTTTAELVEAFQLLQPETENLITSTEDLENTLCEFHKYCAASKQPHYNERTKEQS